MKKRNTTIFAFLLLAAVGMGVGYAALAQDFEVKGNMALDTTLAEDQFDEAVRFDTSKTDDIVASRTDATNKDTISFTNNWHAVFSVNSLEAKGDSTTATFTILNTGDVDAFIASYTLTDTYDKDVYEVTTNINEVLVAPKTVIAAQNGSKTFTVTVALKVDPTETDTDEFTLSFQAQSVSTIQ